jgi:hypothetical protein
MTELGFGMDGMGIHAGMAPWQEAGREAGHFTVARFDNEMSDWASRKMGGEGTGQRGYIPPNDLTFHQLGIKPYSVTMSPWDEHNLFTTAGWTRILTLAINGGGTTFASGTCRIGVGTGTATTGTAAATTATDLSAATGPTGRFFQPVNGTPTVSLTGTGVARLALTSVFDTGSANFTWSEWCIDQGAAVTGTGAAVATMLNRAVSAQGSKVQGNTWTATCNLDFT